MNTPVYICDAVRTPFGRRGGVLSGIRVDDLAAMPLIALAVRNAQVDWEQLDDVLFGCAHASSENIAQLAALLAGLPHTVSGATINRLCGSGLDAVGSAARAIRSGEASLMIAGGVEAMCRSPEHVMANEVLRDVLRSSDEAPGSPRNGQLAHPGHEGYDHWAIRRAAENIAGVFAISRQSQDRYAAASTARTRAAAHGGYFGAEITPVTVAPTGVASVIVTADECSTLCSVEQLAAVPPFVGSTTITHGNSAGDADGACALLLAGEKAAYKYSLLPRARVLGMAVAGVPHHMTGIGPATAARKVLVQTRLAMEQIEVIELNDSTAAQSLAVLRDWALQDDDPRVNPNGGAIALGNPYGASGARLVATAINQLHRIKGRYALCATCVGAGQGIALVIERV